MTSATARAYNEVWGRPHWSPDSRGQASGQGAKPTEADDSFIRLYNKYSCGWGSGFVVLNYFG